MNTLTNEQIDTHLDKVESLQWENKKPVVIALTQTVLHTALANPIFWPDEVDISFVLPADKNCVGPVYRRLCLLGVLERTFNCRRTRSKNSRGTTIFQYRLASSEKAQRVLRVLELIPTEEETEEYVRTP